MSMTAWTWALIIAAAIGLCVAMILDWGGSGVPASACPDTWIKLVGHEQTVCVPRLCEEDEVLDWIGNDVRGCIPAEGVRP